MSDNLNKTYLTGPQTARRYNITDRSLARWTEDPRLSFPPRNGDQHAQVLCARRIGDVGKVPRRPLYSEGGVSET